MFKSCDQEVGNHHGHISSGLEGTFVQEPWCKHPPHHEVASVQGSCCHGHQQLHRRSKDGDYQVRNEV